MGDPQNHGFQSTEMVQLWMIWGTTFWETSIKYYKVSLQKKQQLSIPDLPRDPRILQKQIKPFPSADEASLLGSFVAHSRRGRLKGRPAD